jgi:hypothetical protein
MKTKSPHLERDWLYQKYVVENLSTYDIGKLVSRDPKRVYEKLIDFGIPTRPRGHNLANGDSYMSQPNAVNPFQGKTHSEETRKTLSEKASIKKPWLRGKANGMSGRTGESNPNFKDGSAPERQRLYASGDWKELVRAVYKRDNYHCARCGSPHTGTRSLCAHHVKPWAGNPALRFDMDNLITLCRLCHHWVHSKENAAREYLE